MSPASEAPCTLFCPRSGCSPVPGRPTWPVTMESAIRQRALSVPCTDCEIPIPQKMMPRSRTRVAARDFAQSLGVDPAHRRHRLGSEVPDVALEVLETLGVGFDVLAVVEPFAHDDVEQGVQQGDVGARGELEHVGGVLSQRLAARVHDDEGLARASRLLEEGGRHRMVSVGLAPVTMITSASAQAVKGAVTAPEPIPSRSATTDEA